MSTSSSEHTWERRELKVWSSVGIGAVVEGNLGVAAGTAGCTSNGFLIGTCVGYIINPRRACAGGLR